MFYYLYQITNLVNGKIYVGVHKTNDLNDGYMGSGKIIRSAIQKHGIANFSKVILEQFDDSVAMYAREKEVVTEEFLARKDTYNLRRGGTGGFDYINKVGLSYKGFNSAQERNTAISPFSKHDARADEIRRLARVAKIAWLDSVDLSAIVVKQYANGRLGAFTGKVHSDISKLLMSCSHSGKHVGDKNSQYGTQWSTNGIINAKIKSGDLIPDGWRKGRLLKNK